METSTPWTGETINGTYIPSQAEIQARAAEIKQRRPERDHRPKNVSIVTEGVAAMARRKSPYVAEQRG